MLLPYMSVVDVTTTEADVISCYIMMLYIIYNIYIIYMLYIYIIYVMMALPSAQL